MSLKNGPVNSMFPWYKERLQTKYLRDLSEKQQLSGALDGRRWRFLYPGMDDFRDGYPTVYQELFTQCKCETSPAVFGMPKHTCSVKLPQKRLSKDQACYSKRNPLSQTQRKFIDAVEHRLTQHPLALYPHLESGMTPELFDQVLSVLDPDMCVKGELGTTSPTNETRQLEESRPQCAISPSVSLRETVKPFISIKSQIEKCEDSRPTNPYKWQKHREAQLKAQMNNVKDLQEDDKLMITKHFCEWINSLGGETSDLTESTILDLFKSDYEKKFLLTPVSDFTKPPATLGSSVDDHHGDPPCEAFKLSKACKPNKPQTYETGKKRAAIEPLRTAPDITDSLDFEAQLREQDKELKQSHAVQAFRQFIIDKGVEMPRFLRVLFSEEEQKNRIRASNSAASTSTHKGRAVH